MRLDAPVPSASPPERVLQRRPEEEEGPQLAPAGHQVLELQRRFGNRYVQRRIALARQAAGQPEGGELDSEVESSIQRARGGGQALDGGVRAQMEPALGTDLGSVRIHTGDEADRLNQAVSARSFTTGNDIFFRQGEYSPGSSSGRELLAHELTHVVQQGGAPVQAKLALGPVDTPEEREADEVAATVMRSEKAEVSAASSATVRRKPDKPAAPAQAPKRTYYGPFRVPIPGKVSPEEAKILTFMQVFNLDRAAAATISASGVWSRFELTEAHLKAGALSVEIDSSFFQTVAQEKRIGEEPEKAQQRKAGLAGADPAVQKEVKEDVDEEFERRTNRKAPGRGASRQDKALWADIQDEVLYNRENVQTWQALPKDLQELLTGGGTPAPKDMPRYLRVAGKLANATPDQRGLYFKLAKGLAKDLDEFEASVDAFLEERAGLAAAGGSPGAAAGPGAAVSGGQPAAADENDIDVGTVLWSAVKTVAIGVGILALAGIVVGAEILTAGQVTWLLVAVAGAGGFKAYLDRREEIEKSGYDVPGYNTAIHAAGDAVGLSPLIEGITGERLGTQQKLGTQLRSEQLGAGAGSIATLFIGSRAFRQGQTIGQSIRTPKPGATPSGPNAAANVKVPQDQMPARPAKNPNPGPREKALRDSLPADDQVGLDLWSENLRARGKDPEASLSKMNDAQTRAAIEKARKGYDVGVEKAQEAAHQQARATDDPLRPQLKNVEKKGDIEIHYETRPPSAEEIAHAQSIAKATGEPVKLFGDTASKISYPGIDGTIGNPPRPLSLKSHSPQANAGSARFAAQEALAKAKTHGYSQVEVDISMPGKTVAEVKAGWDVGPTRPGDHPLGAFYEGSIVARIIIRCADGIWIVPKGPAVTSTVPDLPGSVEKEKEKK